MSLQNTPASLRTHIGFFGRCNVGKSSVVNAFVGQRLSIVSPKSGTTTDPVSKTMELLPLGPVVVIDTAGFDDEGELGSERTERTRKVLDRIDIAVLVVDATRTRSAAEREMEALFTKRRIPYLVAVNKTDLQRGTPAPGEIPVSALTGEGIEALRLAVARLAGERQEERPLLHDLFRPGQTVVLVTPIDASAPKGRMILPEQMATRDILDHGGICLTVQPKRLKDALGRLREKPALVVTDSQAFQETAQGTPDDIPLTSFSLLMARYKSVLAPSVAAIGALRRLEDGDAVLISEGCTHHRQCADIGTVKIPRWLAAYTGKRLAIHTSSGHDFPDDLSPYAVIIHCGGCMLGEQEMRRRMEKAEEAGVPMTNYGIAIAAMKGILPRALAPLGYSKELA